MPSYQHDCKEGCVYLGQDRPRAGEPQGNYIDVYYHPGWRHGLGYFTRRWGSKGNEYKTKHQNDANEGDGWIMAKQMAVKKGFVFPTT
jgi:hypothetical protein